MSQLLAVDSAALEKWMGSLFTWEEGPPTADRLGRCIASTLESLWVHLGGPWRALDAKRGKVAAKSAKVTVQTVIAHLDKLPLSCWASFKTGLQGAVQCHLELLLSKMEPCVSSMPCEQLVSLRAHVQEALCPLGKLAAALHLCSSCYKAVEELAELVLSQWEAKRRAELESIWCSDGFNGPATVVSALRQVVEHSADWAGEPAGCERAVSLLTLAAGDVTKRLSWHVEMLTASKQAGPSRRVNMIKKIWRQASRTFEEDAGRSRKEISAEKGLTTTTDASEENLIALLGWASALLEFGKQACVSAGPEQTRAEVSQALDQLAKAAEATGRAVGRALVGDLLAASVPALGAVGDCLESANNYMTSAASTMESSTSLQLLVEGVVQEAVGLWVNAFITKPPRMSDRPLKAAVHADEQALRVLALTWGVDLEQKRYLILPVIEVKSLLTSPTPELVASAAEKFKESLGETVGGKLLEAVQQACKS